MKNQRLDREVEDVRAFQIRTGIPMATRPTFDCERLRERYRFLREELDELGDAIDEHDICGVADALIDLVYVAKGTGLIAGFPWRELWDDVHSANMAKEPRATKRSKHDAIKPPGWRGPQTAAILDAASRKEDDGA